MIEQELINLMGSFGFPVAVTAFLLIERGKTMKDLTRAINDLTLIIKEKLRN